MTHQPGGVPRRTAYGAGQDRRGAVLHQLQGRLAARYALVQQRRLGQLRREGRRLAGHRHPSLVPRQRPRLIDFLLYDIVHGGRAEKGPTTTNWENSKNLLAKGQVGSLLLGSWAISQLRDAAAKAGTNPGRHRVHTVPRAEGRKVLRHAALRLPASGERPLTSVPLPSNLQPYVDNGVKLVERSEARTAQVNAIDDASEIGLAKQDYRQKIVDLARGAQPGRLDDYFADLDRRWAEASRSVRP